MRTKRILCLFVLLLSVLLLVACSAEKRITANWQSLTYTPCSCEGARVRKVTVEIPNDCLHAGTCVIKCASCGHRWLRTIEGEHKYKVTTYLAATCITEGYEERTCSVCHDVVSTVFPFGGHDFYETVEREGTSCADPGRTILTCRVCSHTEDAPSKFHHQPNKINLCMECGAPVSAEQIVATFYDPTASRMTMLDLSGRMFLAPGAHERIIFSTYPSVTSSKIHFRTTDPSVATVDECGTVTAVGYGACCIIAEVEDSTLAAHYYVAVTKYPSNATFVEPFKLAPAYGSFPLDTPQTFTLTMDYECNPRAITVTADDPDAVEITVGEYADRTCTVTVTPKQAGAATITVTVTTKTGKMQQTYTYSFG